MSPPFDVISLDAGLYLTDGTQRCFVVIEITRKNFSFLFLCCSFCESARACLFAARLSAVAELGAEHPLWIGTMQNESEALNIQGVSKAYF